MKALAAVAVAAALVAGTTASATASSPPSTVGSPGLGDPFFPLAGNGGYDVDHYDLDLAFEPATGVVAGTATIDARAEQTLTRFDLDLRGFDVSTISVNGRRATFTRSGQELVITPSRSLARHDKFRVVVVYRGKPQPVIDADGSLDGWVPTDDGAVVVSEPQGSPSWFPVNDYPTDKATLSLQMTVPSGLQVLGNGLPQPPRRVGSRTRYEWDETKPMAPYLTTVAIGQFNVAVGRTSNRVPIITGVDPRLASGSAASLARIGEVLDWETTLFGPYPFESVGAIVDYAPDVGYSLETQTRPVFTDVVDDATLVHELAHQWVGDSVTLASWPDIWLHEGFATYTEWLWSEHDGGPTAAELFQDDYDGIPADDEFWTIPPSGLPDASELFSGVVYDRGAMTLHVLRTTIGDDAFFRLLRTWVARNRYGNVSTADFTALAEQVSHRDLDALFTAWLSTPGKPPPPAAAAAAPAAAKPSPAPARR